MVDSGTVKLIYPVRLTLPHRIRVHSMIVINIGLAHSQHKFEDQTVSHFEMQSRLPKEIILVILEEIDEPCDLLSLALCNRFFRRLIIPRHLSFRHIRYNENKASLWKYLVDRPNYAARIRKLEVVNILAGTGYIRPSSLPRRKKFPAYTNPSPEGTRDIIYSIFPLLSRLRRLVWLQCGPEIVNRLERLSQLPLLEELHISIFINKPNYSALEIKSKVFRLYPFGSRITNFFLLP
jgi:hypothetical protein